MTYKTTKITFSTILGLLLFSTCCVSIFSCSKKDATAKPLSSFTGEELFRGIIFKEGIIARNIPTLRPIQVQREQYGIQVRQSIDSFQTAVISEIKKINPNYFDEFKQEICSRNYNQISKALLSGATGVFEAGLNIPKYHAIFEAIEESVANKSIAKYNLSSEEGKNAYTRLLKSRIKANTNKQTNIGALNNTLDDGNTNDDTLDDGNTADLESPEVALAIPIFVVWAAVWEAAVAVNVVAAVTNTAAAVVLVYVYAKYKFWPKEGLEEDFETLLSQEKIVKEISECSVIY